MTSEDRQEAAHPDAVLSQGRVSALRRPFGVSGSLSPPLLASDFVLGLTFGASFTRVTRAEQEREGKQRERQLVVRCKVYCTRERVGRGAISKWARSLPVACGRQRRCKVRAFSASFQQANETTRRRASASGRQASIYARPQQEADLHSSSTLYAGRG